MDHAAESSDIGILDLLRKAGPLASLNWPARLGDGDGGSPAAHSADGQGMIEREACEGGAGGRATAIG